MRELTLQVIDWKSLLSVEVSVTSFMSSSALGPITLMEVYMEVTSLTRTEPSAGRCCVSQATQRVCWIVGEIRKKLQGKGFFYCWFQNYQTSSKLPWPDIEWSGLQKFRFLSYFQSFDSPLSISKGTARSDISCIPTKPDLSNCKMGPVGLVKWCTLQPREIKNAL